MHVISARAEGKRGSFGLLGVLFDEVLTMVEGSHEIAAEASWKMKAILGVAAVVQIEIALVT